LTMRKTAINNLPVYQFHLLEKFSDFLGHAVLSREGGVSRKPFDSLNVRYGIGDKLLNVKKNRALICRALGIEPQNLVSAEQIHSKNVQVVDADFMRGKAPGECYGVDAFVSDVPGAALMMQVADCQAQLLYDPVRRVAAAVHAGWKGLAQDISGETIKVMKSRFGCKPADILVGVAPSLGPCCAFFSDPEKELPKSFHKFIDGEKRVDLWSFSLQQLHRHGIAPGHIELARVCTQCNNGPDIESRGRFFSFRGEKGITGRFGVVVFLKALPENKAY
jgi:YfiH family protein